MDRYCPVCRQVDDHPRHQIAGTVDDVAPHMDCCAEVGCPDGSCTVVVRNKKGRTGEEFRSLIAEEAEDTRTLLDDRPEQVRHFTMADVDQRVHGGLAAGAGRVNLQGADR